MPICFNMKPCIIACPLAMFWWPLHVVSKLLHDMSLLLFWHFIFFVTQFTLFDYGLEPSLQCLGN